MGRVGLRQRLEAVFGRHGPLARGSPFELKKKRGVGTGPWWVKYYITNKQRRFSKMALTL